VHKIEKGVSRYIFEREEVNDLLRDAEEMDPVESSEASLLNSLTTPSPPLPPCVKTLKPAAVAVSPWLTTLGVPLLLWKLCRWFVRPRNLMFLLSIMKTPNVTAEHTVLYTAISDPIPLNFHPANTATFRPTHHSSAMERTQETQALVSSS
jgi:hypothetical protein